MRGRCKKCGAEKDYPVWDPAYDKLKTTVVDKQSAKW